MEKSLNLNWYDAETSVIAATVLKEFGVVLNEYEWAEIRDAMYRSVNSAKVRYQKVVA